MATKDRTLPELREIVDDLIKVGRVAAEKATKEAEVSVLNQLRARLAGKVIYLYDESHENRFAKGQFREYGHPALTFSECLSGVRNEILIRGTKEHWPILRRALEAEAGAKEPTLEQPIVFSVDYDDRHRDRWNAFWCVTSVSFCEVIERQLKYRKEELEKDGHCGCDNYDDQ